jgi:hypothetical protein
MTPEPRTLSERECNRALLARQHLLEPATGPIARTVERIGGVQAQYAPSMYVGLWSRMRDLERDDLTRAIERRSVVQATLMRVTIHLVARGDYWAFALAARTARRTLWLRSRRGMIDERAMQAAADAVAERLETVEILSRKELEALVGKPRADGVGLWIDLVRVPPSGTWERRRADLFALASSWVGPPKPPGAAPPPAPPSSTPPPDPTGPPRPAHRGDLTLDDAIDHLVRRYLAGFGPAARDDIASYTGIRKSDLAPTLERLPLRRFRSTGGDELLDLQRAPLPDPDTPAPVRFLPTWDATLLVHARRTGVLPEQHRKKIFHTKNPHSLPTFLVDGAVAGTWRHIKGKIELEPFDRLDPAGLRAVRAEADRLAAFHA